MRALWAAVLILQGADDPLPAEKREKLKRELDEAVLRGTKAVEAAPKSVEPYSRRADAYFFRGDFKEAVADYDKMAELEPALDAQHWRRGIAYFYAGQYEKAAGQFERYHSFDDVDRENGIWRFLSQTQAFGVEKAREGLLKYKKDDREPFPSVYQLFAGKMTAEKILEQIQSASLDDEEREKRLFYARLYIGLNLAVGGKAEEAIPHLRQAVGNSWGPKAGYGPNYMWHVGRLRYDALVAAKRK